MTLTMRHGMFVLLGSLAAGLSSAQGPPPQAQVPANDPGRRSFESRCSRCHGGDGKGAEMGPDITTRLQSYSSDEQLTNLIHTGIVAGGMPATPVNNPELADLVRFVHTLTPRPAPGGGRGFGGRGQARITAELANGQKLEGSRIGEGINDMILRTDDTKVHLLRKSGEKYREVTSEVDWPGYNGDPRGNRYATMSQITKSNVNRLATQWIFAYPSPGRGAAPPNQLQGTPVVVGGLMYVTSANECIALDAGTGRQVWRFTAPKANNLPQVPAVNRGAAVAGDKVFIELDDARVVGINRFSGQKVWESRVADPAQNYFATSAPLTAGDLVITGVAGGEHGANGVVVAFNQESGKEAWRFNVIPKRGEPGSETWQGQEIDHGGGPTWFTGSYDPELDTVYWPTGNPSEEYNGDRRLGDNLYSDCILALDRKSGKLKWHYQFTPHDLWDWDSTETAVLVDAPWQGQPRKLMLHADRNGFYYVFDRTDGKLLLARQFLKSVTWASGIGADGRPVKLPNQEPTEKGTRVCPSQDGATNWYSPTFNPATGMYYFQTNEKCSVYTKRDQPEWVAGQTYLGGSQSGAPDPRPQRVLKAIDYQTGETKWEIPQPGFAGSWGGTISTATGVVFFMDDTGDLVAADATSGKLLWTFSANVSWHASPMMYQFDGKQYLAFAAGGNIIAMALPD